jgi:hypothetical protein
MRYADINSVSKLIQFDDIYTCYKCWHMSNTFRRVTAHCCDFQTAARSFYKEKWCCFSIASRSSGTRGATSCFRLPAVDTAPSRLTYAATASPTALRTSPIVPFFISSLIKSLGVHQVRVVKSFGLGEWKGGEKGLGIGAFRELNSGPLAP